MCLFVEVDLLEITIEWIWITCGNKVRLSVVREAFLVEFAL